MGGGQTEKGVEGGSCLLDETGHHVGLTETGT